MDAKGKKLINWFGQLATKQLATTHNIHTTMPPSSGDRPQGSFRSRLGSLNPAFAAAHGISPVKSPTSDNENEDGKNTHDDVNVVVTDSPRRGGKQSVELPISPSPVADPERQKKKKAAIGAAKVNQAIAKARTTGKLQASDCDLETPLPRNLFEFPSLADTVDLSLDNCTNPDNLKPWESHVAETLTLVDFSDNISISKFPQLETTDQHNSSNSFERYRSIQVFRARRCRLQSFPLSNTLQESWPQLITLDLGGNQLEGEFPLLYLPKTIRELDISGNSLKSLKSSTDPSTSANLPQLMSLDISSNEITSTGLAPIMNVPNLQRLNCGDNKIYNLDFLLNSISSSEKSLTTLSAPNCRLSDLDGRQPIDLASFTKLLSVDVSCNSLCRMPKIPFTVQHLNVNENIIKGLDGLLEKDDEGELVPSSLVVLQVKRNKVTSLNASIISKLTKLNRLDLQFNSIKDLPLELGNLDNLQQMHLEGNHVLSLRSSGVRCDLHDTDGILRSLRNRAKKPTKSIPSPADSSGSTTPQKSNNKKQSTTSAINVEVGSLLDSLLVGTKTIKYSGMHAQMLPLQLLDEMKTSSQDVVHGIKQMDVSKNQLKSIEDEWFSLLPQLTTLEAQQNQLTMLPLNIRELAFSHLRLSRNRLTSHAIQSSLLHPSRKGNLISESLQVLDLSFNKLESFPPELLRQFKSLRDLNLSRNRIKSLKNVVDYPYRPCCDSLEHLNLSDNRIEDLGGDDFPLLLATGCPSLKSLKLENNELQLIPMTLGLIESLNVIELRGNPQRQIRYELLDKSTSDLLQYMRNRMTSKAKQRAMVRVNDFLAAPSPEQASADEDASNSENEPSNNKAEEKAMAARRDTATNADDQPPARVAQSKDTLKPAKAMKASNQQPQTTPSSKPTTAQERNRSPETRKVPISSGIPPPKTRQGLAPVSLGRNPNHSAKSRLSTPTTATKAKAPKSSSTSKNTLSSPLLEELEKSIAELAAEMDRPGISEPKRYAIKKKLAMERSKRLREERRLKQERDRNSRTSYKASDPGISMMH